MKPDQNKIELIQSWHDFAILELSKTETFNPSVQAIAERMGVLQDEVSASLERLRMTGMIQFTEGHMNVNSEDSFSKPDIPSNAIKRMHEQLIRKALSALYYQPMAVREFDSYILAFAPERMSEAKQRLQDFIQEFCGEFGAGEKSEEVYSLTLQFCKLSQ